MFNINIQFYSIAIVTALLVNIIMVLIISKKSKNFNITEINCLLLYENIGSILGAKVLSFLINYSKFNGNFNFEKIGFLSYGAAIGGTIFILLYCIQFKKSLKEIMAICLPSFPLMYSIGKVGCFLVGCCYGIEYNGIFKIMYKYSTNAPNNIYLFPVQLLESIIFLIIYIYMMYNYNKNKLNLKTFGIFFIISSLSKFIMDFLRMSHNGIISLNQVISLIVLLLGIVIFKK